MKKLLFSLILAPVLFAQSGVWRDGCAAAGASGTAYTCSYSVSPTLITGHVYIFKADVANTGTTPTINFNSLGAKTMTKAVSGTLAGTLIAGDIQAGMWVVMVYDGTNMEIVSRLGSSTPQSLIGTSLTFTGTSGIAVCTGTCTVIVPLPVANAQFCAINDNNVSTAITFAALGGSAMYQNGTRTAYGTAATGTLTISASSANEICIVGRDSTHYFTVSFSGGTVSVT